MEWIPPILLSTFDFVPNNSGDLEDQVQIYLVGQMASQQSNLWDSTFHSEVILSCVSAPKSNLHSYQLISAD